MYTEDRDLFVKKLDEIAVKTPVSHAVGNLEDAVKAAYGEPDKIRGDKYIYYCDEDKSIGLVFEIENNKVDEIEMGYLD